LEKELAEAKEHTAFVDRENERLKRDLLIKTTSENEQLSKQIALLTSMNSNLEKKYVLSEESHKDNIIFLTSQIDTLKREYFFSTAVALKLTCFVKGKLVNVSINALYDQILQSNIPFCNWSPWIKAKLES